MQAQLRADLALHLLEVDSVLALVHNLPLVSVAVLELKECRLSNPLDSVEALRNLVSELEQVQVPAQVEVSVHLAHNRRSNKERGSEAPPWVAVLVVSAPMLLAQSLAFLSARV